MSSPSTHPTSHGLTPDDGMRSLHEHIVERATAARLEHPNLETRSGLLALLEDQRFVRFSVSLVFDAHELRPGELAWVQPKGATPKHGFNLIVDPSFESRDRDLAFIAAYQMVVVNYGEIAGGEDAEVLAATLLGVDRESVYRKLCELSDELLAGGG